MMASLKIWEILNEQELEMLLLRLEIDALYVARRQTIARSAITLPPDMFTLSAKRESIGTGVCFLYEIISAQLFLSV